MHSERLWNSNYHCKNLTVQNGGLGCHWVVCTHITNTAKTTALVDSTVTCREAKRQLPDFCCVVQCTKFTHFKVTSFFTEIIIILSLSKTECSTVTVLYLLKIFHKRLMLRHLLHIFPITVYNVKQIFQSWSTTSNKSSSNHGLQRQTNLLPITVYNVKQIFQSRSTTSNISTYNQYHTLHSTTEHCSIQNTFFINNKW